MPGIENEHLTVDLETRRISYKNSKKNPFSLNLIKHISLTELKPLWPIELNYAGYDYPFHTVLKALVLYSGKECACIRVRRNKAEEAYLLCTLTDEQINAELCEYANSFEGYDFTEDWKLVKRKVSIYSTVKKIYYHQINFGNYLKLRRYELDLTNSTVIGWFDWYRGDYHQPDLGYSQILKK